MPEIGERYNPFKLWHGPLVPEWLCQRPEVSAGAKLCFGRLKQHAGRSGKAYPRQDTLADELGVSDRQVRDYLAELETHGLVEVSKAGRGRAARVYFLWHAWAVDPAAECQCERCEQFRTKRMRVVNRNCCSGQQAEATPAAAASSDDNRNDCSAQKAVNRNDSSRLTGTIVPSGWNDSSGQIEDEENPGKDSGERSTTTAAARRPSETTPTTAHLNFDQPLFRWFGWDAKQSEVDQAERAVEALAERGLSVNQSQLDAAAVKASEWWQQQGRRGPKVSIRPFLIELQKLVEPSNGTNGTNGANPGSRPANGGGHHPASPGAGTAGVRRSGRVSDAERERIAHEDAAAAAERRRLLGLG